MKCILVISNKCLELLTLKNTVNKFSNFNMSVLAASLTKRGCFTVSSNSVPTADLKVSPANGPERKTEIKESENIVMNG